MVLIKLSDIVWPCIESIEIEINFMPPRSKIRGHLVFFLLCIIPPFWHFVNLSETLILLITFEQWKLELWYFTWLLLVARPFSGYQNFWFFLLQPFHGNQDFFLLVTLTLEYGLLFEKTLTFLITFEKWVLVLELWYFTYFLVVRSFCWYLI